MTKKPFIIVPALLIIHSVLLSLNSLYSGPSRYSSVGFSAVCPELFILVVAAFIAKKLKAKYWRISIITLALSGIPRSLIATFPAHTSLLVAVTLVLDLISAATLFMAFRHDAFDFSALEGRQTSGVFYLVMLLVIIVGIFLYFGLS